MRLAVPNTCASRVRSRARCGPSVGHGLRRPLAVVVLAMSVVLVWLGLAVLGVVWLGCFEDSPLRLVMLPGNALG